MTRYTVLYTAPIAVAERFAQATPEEALEGMQLWVDWSNRVGAALVDPGGPLANAKRVTLDGATDSDSNVLGMSILEVDSMEEALELVKDHHHLQWADGCEIVVLEEIPLPEMQRPPR